MTAALEPARTERCDCCELPVESCGKALETRRKLEAARERERLLGLSGWWPARWAGRCSGCGEHFGVDDPIRFAPGGTHNGYVAGCCGEGDR